MKSLSSHVKESIDTASHFTYTVFTPADDTTEGKNISIGWVDKETRIEIHSINDERTFKIISGKKYSDGSDKKSYSKSYDFIDSVPEKWKNACQELLDFLDSEELNTQIDSELEGMLSESVQEPISNQQLINMIISLCKRSKRFVKKLLWGLNSVDNSYILENRDTVVLEERSWFSAIMTNAALYFAAIQVAKISNKWIRALLLGLIAERVITTNDIPNKLRNLLN
jgi:hypothetical protein